MAEEYAKTSEKPGVVLVTSDSKETNVVTSMQDVFFNNTSLIIFCEQIVTNAIKTDVFQKLNMIEISKACIKWNVMMKTVAELSKWIMEVFEIAMSWRSGPCCWIYSKISKLRFWSVHFHSPACCRYILARQPWPFKNQAGRDLLKSSNESRTWSMFPQNRSCTLAKGWALCRKWGLARWYNIFCRTFSHSDRCGSTFQQDQRCLLLNYPHGAKNGRWIDDWMMGDDGDPQPPYVHRMSADVPLNLF